jgi:hypothetical protein
VIDLGASDQWTSLGDTTLLPFAKEIAAATESGYSSNSGDLSSHLVGLWHLDEAAGTSGSGSVSDSSGGGLNGTPSGSVTFGSAGKLGYGATTAGGDITVPTSSCNFPGTDPFSFSVWVRTTFNSSGNFLYLLDTVSSGNGWQVYLSGTDGTVSFHREAGGVEYGPTSTSSYNDGKWHQITGTYDGTQSKLWIDGSYLGAASDGNSLTTSATSLALMSGTSQTGTIDEAAIWSRALTDSEVLELYRRGADRIKFQVRSCGVSDCSDASWMGPDGTANTYYSELQNNTSVDSSGNPTGTVNASGLSLDWSGSFFTAAAMPANNRYFQYRIYMESDDENGLCSGSACMPELSSLTIGPTGRYYGGTATIQNTSGAAYSQLTSFTESDNNTCAKFQISTDGTNWQYWTGSAWSAATTSAQTNSGSDFTASNLSALGAGSFYFKAYLNTNGSLTQSCELSQVKIGY